MRETFIITEKNGKIYRKNRNITGNCIHYSELKCACCNEECVYNCSIHDELDEELENDLMNTINC